MLSVEKLTMLFVDGKVLKDLVPKKSKKHKRFGKSNTLSYALSVDKKNVGFRSNTTSFCKKTFPNGHKFSEDVWVSAAHMHDLIQKMFNNDIKDLVSSNATFREKYLSFPVLRHTLGDNHEVARRICGRTTHNPIMEHVDSLSELRSFNFRRDHSLESKFEKLTKEFEKVKAKGEVLQTKLDAEILKTERLQLKSPRLSSRGRPYDPKIMQDFFYIESRLKMYDNPDLSDIMRDIVKMVVKDPKEVEALLEEFKFTNRHYQRRIFDEDRIRCLIKRLNSMGAKFHIVCDKVTDNGVPRIAIKFVATAIDASIENRSFIVELPLIPSQVNVDK